MNSERRPSPRGEGSDYVSPMHPEPDRLRAVPLFAGLDEGELAKVASWMDVEDYPMGKALTREGAADYEFFVLDEGSIRVEHEGRPLGTLRPGDVFGELALVGDARRRADAIADEDVTVLSMFGTHFRGMQMAMPLVAERLQRLAEARLAQLEASD